MSTTRKNALAQIMRLAWQFVRNDGMTLSRALTVAWRNFRLKAAMLSGRAVRFAYRKLNGEVRRALGTLAAAAINYVPVGTGRATPDCNQLYWDLEAGAYRSFRKANLLAI